MKAKKKAPTQKRYIELKKQVEDEHGETIRKSFYGKTKEEAEKKYRDYLKRVEGLDLSLSPENITLASWASIWLESYKKSACKETSYRTTYRTPTETVIIPYMGDMLLKEITNADITVFLNEVGKEHTLSYLQKIRNCLKEILETAVDNNKLTKSPMKRIKLHAGKKAKVKRTYDRETVNDIIEYSMQHEDGLTIHIMLSMGLRCEEAMGLRYSDINLESRTMNIGRTVTEKDGLPFVSDRMKSKHSERELPIIDDTLYDRLKSRINGFVEKGYNRYRYGEIFIATESYSPVLPTVYTRNNYAKFFRRYVKFSNKTKLILTPHELRHTCGTLLYDQTKDIYAVKMFLGHSSVETTAAYYIDDDVELIRRAVERSKGGDVV